MSILENDCMLIHLFLSVPNHQLFQGLGDLTKYLKCNLYLIIVSLSPLPSPQIGEKAYRVYSVCKEGPKNYCIKFFFSLQCILTLFWCIRLGTSITYFHMHLYTQKSCTACHCDSHFFKKDIMEGMGRNKFGSHWNRCCSLPGRVKISPEVRCFCLDEGSYWILIWGIWNIT